MQKGACACEALCLSPVLNILGYEKVGCFEMYKSHFFFFFAVNMDFFPPINSLGVKELIKTQIWEDL